MNRLIVGLVLGAWLPAVSFAGTNDTDVNTVVTGNTAFALDLYGKLRSQEGNLFLSPYSISTALAMTYGGARGETEKQMAYITGSVNEDLLRRIEYLSNPSALSPFVDGEKRTRESRRYAFGAMGGRIAGKNGARRQAD